MPMSEAHVYISIRVYRSSDAAYGYLLLFNCEPLSHNARIGIDLVVLGRTIRNCAVPNTPFDSHFLLVMPTSSDGLPDPVWAGTGPVTCDCYLDP